MEQKYFKAQGWDVKQAALHNHSPELTDSDNVSSPCYPDSLLRARDVFALILRRAADQEKYTWELVTALPLQPNDAISFCLSW